MLASMIINKKNAVFLFLGFLLAVYMNIPVTGIALFGVVLALILVSLQPQKEAAVSVGGDDDEDF